MDTLGVVDDTAPQGQLLQILKASRPLCASCYRPQWNMIVFQSGNFLMASFTNRLCESGWDFSLQQFLSTETLWHSRLKQGRAKKFGVNISVVDNCVDSFDVIWWHWRSHNLDLGCKLNFSEPETPLPLPLPP